LAWALAPSEEQFTARMKIEPIIPDQVLLGSMRLPLASLADLLERLSVLYGRCEPPYR